MKTTVSYSITEKNITLFLNGNHYNLNRLSDNGEEQEIAKKVYAAIKNGTLDEIPKLLAPGKTIVEQYAGGMFYVTSEGEVFSKAEKSLAIPARLAKQLIKFAKEELPVEPLLNFWANLKLNPSKDSINELYDCLEANFHPITADGCFLAYKKVTTVGEQLMDSHSKTIDNSIGNTVAIEREKVDSNRNNTCSHGLHIASFEYAKGFSGNVLVVVKVNPADVVSVPKDYNAQKMRVCKYEVLSVCTQGEIKKAVVKEEKVYKQNMGKDIDLRDKTVKEIIAIVRAHGMPNFIDVITPAVLKNKQGILKKAATILANAGYKVKTGDKNITILSKRKMDILEKLKKVICKTLNVEMYEITLEAHIQNDLGADSLDVVELVMELEKAFNIAIPDNDVENILTVNDIANWLDKNLPK